MGETQLPGRAKQGSGCYASGAQGRDRACASGGRRASRPRSPPPPPEVLRLLPGPGPERRPKHPPTCGRSPFHRPAAVPSTPTPDPEHSPRGPPYLAAWRARCPFFEARTWTHSPGSTRRPRPGRATRRRGSGCAPPPRPPPLPPLQSPCRPRPPSAPAPARRARPGRRWGLGGGPADPRDPDRVEGGVGI